jgi:hypothetical protein
MQGRGMNQVLPKGPGTNKCANKMKQNNDRCRDQQKNQK